MLISQIIPIVPFASPLRRPGACMPPARFRSYSEHGHLVLTLEKEPSSRLAQLGEMLVFF